MQGFNEKPNSDDIMKDHTFQLTKEEKANGSTRSIISQDSKRRNSRSITDVKKQYLEKNLDPNKQAISMNGIEDLDGSLRGRLSYFLLINPDNLPFLIWKTIIALMIGYLQVHSGFMVAFSLSSTDMISYQNPTIITFYAVAILDSLTCLNTMYYDKGRLVHNRTLIMKRAFKKQ
jgi:hypothetical protein